MVGREGDVFSNRVLHYASSLRGTRQYWFKQRSRLIAMLDTLGMPTIFFTHSAADQQWPELARLICPDDPDSSSSRSKALMENPAIADWSFYHRIHKFIDVFYKGVLRASDYWMSFERQRHGSPHVHGLAWLEDAPNVETLISVTSDEPADQINDLGSSQDGDNPPTAACKQELLEYVNRTITTINPAVLPDGSNVADGQTLHSPTPSPTWTDPLPAWISLLPRSPT